MSRPKVLDAAQARHFVDKGFVVVRGALDPAVARSWVERAYRRLGLRADDPSTWRQARVSLPGETSVLVRDLAPKAWGALCELVGGMERVKDADRHSWSDSFVASFPDAGAAQSARDADLSWHLDGGREPRFLDSPEVGLLTWVLWTDAEEGGGGTVFACDSIGPVARHYAERPEGASKTDVPVMEIAKACRDFFEFTGRAGDVAFALPQMIHRGSANGASSPRFLTARIVELAGPLRFERPGPAGHSLVESAILKALGRERLAFRRKAAPR